MKRHSYHRAAGAVLLCVCLSSFYCFPERSGTTVKLVYEKAISSTEGELFIFLVGKEPLLLIGERLDVWENLLLKSDGIDFELFDWRTGKQVASQSIVAQPGYNDPHRCRAKVFPFREGIGAGV